LHPANSFVPATGTPRPALPSRHSNPNFPDILPKLPPVKFQEILREGQTIVVGRLKITTPVNPGHAFILRRYDTGAISLTTMFKAAFPTAPEEAEKIESTWVRANYDVSGANGSAGADGIPKLRLNGTWVSVALAQHIAPEYGLENILKPLIAAQPDPKQEYRKSSKSAATATQSTPPAEAGTPSAPKRRRALSPATVTDTKAASVRSSPRKTRQSPAPRSTTPAANTPGGGSDETAVEEHEEEADVPGPDPEQDIQEQKALIANLKAQRDAAGVTATPHNPRKRTEVDSPPPTTFNPKEPEIGEREIVQRRRLQPQQKAAAWGTLAFALGLGAVSLSSYFFQ